MKQKDIILITAVALLSFMFSLLLANVLIGTPANRSQKVEVVEQIVADFPTPDQKYFNADSVDPTQLIRIGDSTNPSPFNSN